MSAEMIVYVCDSALKADAARDYLVSVGYPREGVRVASEVAEFTYDAETYGGGQADSKENVWVVIGQKQ